MMRSLYSGVAGLKTHQTKMDVIGNNIANVNTTSYKSQSMTFSDLMYQTTQAASGANPTSGVGGTNARQIGLGAKTSSIKTAITTQGATQTTNDPFDIMITGSAFFVVSNGQENFFTRDGSFYVDGVGNLCMTSTGYNVMGWAPDTADPSKIKQDTVQPLKVMTEANMTYPPEATSKAQISGIIDSNDSNIASPSGRVMNMEIYDNLGYKYTVRYSIKQVTTGSPAEADQGHFTINLEDILDINGKSIIPAGGKIEDIYTFDVNGTEKNSCDIYYSTATGKFMNVGGADNTVTTPTELTLKCKAPAGTSFMDVVMDFTATSNFNNNKTSTIAAIRGDKNGNGSGRKIGEMSGISISKDGRIYASYDNGQSRLLGQIAVAEFPNASGLAKEGDNLYAATQNSGDFDGIGVDITAGGGYMNTGVLEMSNVDLSAEFTEMITTQRGFQANSRIITVSDTLLEELTNLKR